MNRPSFYLLLAGTVCAGAVYAQTPAVAQPSSPAPVVVADGSTPTVAQAPNASVASPNVTQIVYTPQLPSAADLTTAANAQGLTVERIVQTSNQIIAFYRNANGQTSNVAYQSLPPAGTTTAPAPQAPQVQAAPNVIVTSPPPTVIYETAPRVYYDYPAYYYPRVWYPPVSLSFGFGYRGGYYGGYHGGHYHRR